jgi:hypothetical protein
MARRLGTALLGPLDVGREFHEFTRMRQAVIS